MAAALFAFAAVKSAVMQAEAAAWPGSAAICDIHRSGHRDDGMQAGCAFCAAAAHVPIQRLAEPLRSPSWVRWTPPSRPAPPLSRPPAPPAPRARGPPPASV